MIGCFYKSAVAIDVPILTFGIDMQRVSKEQCTPMSIGVFYRRSLGIAQTGLVDTGVVDEQPCSYHQQYDYQNENRESCREATRRFLCWWTCGGKSWRIGKC
jgi:hypothetical protein